MRILIVDDDPEFRLKLRSILQDKGYIVEEANSGLEAIFKIELFEPNVVLLDLVLNDTYGIDGLTICSGIRDFNKKRVCPGIYVIFLTARVSNAIIRSDMKMAGGNDFVPKPRNKSEDKDFIVELLASLSKAQETLYREDTIRDAAMKDSHTGLNNQASLTWHLTNHVNCPFAIVFIDLDNFKMINDKYGHLVGDRVMEVVSFRLKQVVRGDDMVFRYGGDEFVVVMATTDIDSAENRKEEIRRFVTESPIQIGDIQI